MADKVNKSLEESTLSISDLKKGSVFYTVTVSNTIERYKVIDRDGMQFALNSEGGPCNAELCAIILHHCTKFKSKELAEKYLGK